MMSVLFQLVPNMITHCQTTCVDMHNFYPLLIWVYNHIYRGEVEGTKDQKRNKQTKISK